MQPCPVQIGDSISILTAGEVTKYLKVEYIEPLPESRDLIKDFGSLAASGTSNNNKIAILEMPGTKSSDTYHELFVGWMEILDLIEVSIKQPSSQSRFMTKSGSITLGPWSGEVPITVYQDDVLYMDVTNIHSATQAKNRVMFFGYRVVCTALENEATAKSLAMQKGKQVFPLIAGGFST